MPQRQTPHVPFPRSETHTPATQAPSVSQSPQNITHGWQHGTIGSREFRGDMKEEQAFTRLLSPAPSRRVSGASWPSGRAGRMFVARSGDIQRFHKPSAFALAFISSISGCTVQRLSDAASSCQPQIVRLRQQLQAAQCHAILGEEVSIHFWAKNPFWAENTRNKKGVSVLLEVKNGQNRTCTFTSQLM